MKKVLLSIVSVLLITTPAYAANFTDVPASDPDYAAVSDIIARGIAMGYGDGTFGVDRLVTRAEATKFIASTVGLDCSAYANTEPDFTDTSEAYGLKEYIACFKELGFASGYGDGRFGPQNEVLGPEFLKMLYRASGITVNTSNPPVYTDLSDTSLTPYIAIAIQHGIRPVATNNTINNISLFRRYVARYLYNFINYVEANSPAGTYQITSLEYAEELKDAIDAYYPDQDLENWEIAVYQVTDTHAYAVVRRYGTEFPSAISAFLIKEADTWEMVLPLGHDHFSCEEIEPYNFPTSMIAECWDSANQEVVTR